MKTETFLDGPSETLRQIDLMLEQVLKLKGNGRIAGFAYVAVVVKDGYDPSDFRAFGNVSSGGCGMPAGLQHLIPALISMAYDLMGPDPGSAQMFARICGEVMAEKLKLASAPPQSSSIQ